MLLLLLLLHFLSVFSHPITSLQFFEPIIVGPKEELKFEDIFLWGTVPVLVCLSPI